MIMNGFLRSCHAARLVILALGLLATSTAVAQTGKVQLLYFTSANCPPCRQMEPLIEEFMRQQYPISKIDTQQPSEWVQQFQVTQTPTAILLIGDQIFQRHSGLLTTEELLEWFRAAKAVAEPRASFSDGVGSNQLNAAAQPFEMAQGNRSVARNPDTMLVGTRQPSTTSESVALEATVRLRVEDDAGFSYATGSIIHVDGNEALVLTCGHVFRDSQGQGVITADWNWNTSQPVTFPGKLIAYDADKTDVALLTIRCGRTLPIVQLAPRRETLNVDQMVFSVGCDHGEPPTIRHTHLKKSAIYNGVKKIEIHGRPVDGRSGGGLFTTDGKLIGVCNAAAVDFDEGIYSALENIYRMIEGSNLIALFEDPRLPAGSGLEIAEVAQSNFGDGDAFLNLNPPDLRPLQVAAAMSMDVREQRLEAGRSIAPQISQVVWEGASDSTASVDGGVLGVGKKLNPGTFNPGQPITANTNIEAWEAIVILRHRQQPELTKTFVIAEPNDQLMEYLGQIRPANEHGSDATRLAQLRQEMPQVQPSRNQNSAWTRAQSPY